MKGFITTGTASPTVPPKNFREQTPVLIGVAKDRAFSYFHESSLDALRKAGTEQVEVSPLREPSANPDAAEQFTGLCGQSRAVAQ
jgi:cobyrinic acid a,c-diamide synthase